MGCTSRLCRFRVLHPLLLIVALGSIFPAFSQGYNAVLITEIMADPTPVVGLPNAEYLEILNRTQQPVSLKGWQLVIGTRTSVLPDSVLPSGGRFILCSQTNVSLFSSFGRVIGLTPFSLANAGAVLALRNNKGNLIYSVAYKDTWWPTDKRAGGYALEMVDSNNPCGETGNWKVSTAPAGGTPGKVNSVAGNNPDLMPPLAERVELSGDSQVDIYFNEKLDSLVSIQAMSFEFKGRTVRKASIQTPAYRILSLLLDSPLLVGQRYELTLKNVADCTGNYLKEEKFELGVPVKADSGDVILNEILYDPRVGGKEFVEIANRTQNYINLKNWAIGVVKNGQPTSFSIISTTNLLLPPQGFVAFTTGAAIVAAEYPAQRPRIVLEVASLPTFTNGSGGVALRDASGMIFDKFEYDDDYHSPLLTETKGVSLERIYPEKYGNDRVNWQSAAFVVGFATPGYANSQGLNGPQNDDFVVEPEAFTPNGDGIDEYVTISYRSSVAGRVASIRIYDLHGRLVRNLVQNQTIGTNGDLRWEGTDDQGSLVRNGYYLLMIDSFDNAGNTQQFKKRVVLMIP